MMTKLIVIHVIAHPFYEPGVKTIFDAEKISYN